MFLLGFLTREGLDAFVDSSDVAGENVEVGKTNSTGRSTAPTNSISQSGDKKAEETAVPDNYVSLPYLPEDPFPRLEALENAHYQVPGYALAHLVPQVFDANNHISPSMSYIMELSDEEEQSFNALLDRSIEKIRKIENELAEIQMSEDGTETVVVSSFTDDGNVIRGGLLNEIESQLGYERRQIFEMVMINQPAAFGSYGEKSLALKDPQFELVDGH